MISYFAAALTITGEILLGFGKPHLVPYSYIFFLIGDVIWIYWGLKKKIYPVVVVNIAFFVLGVRVLINWL